MISAAQQAELFAPEPVPVAPPEPPGPALRLSKSGACARQLAYRLHGVAGIADTPEQRARMDLGHAFETRVIDLMQAEGWLIQSRQLEVSIRVDGPAGPIEIVGHVDGLVETPRRAARIRLGDYDPIGLTPMVLEIKSMKWSMFKVFVDAGFTFHKYFADYRAQVSTYLGALGLTHALVVATPRGDKDTPASVRTKDLTWVAEVYERDDALVDAVRARFAAAACSTAPGPELRDYAPNTLGILPKPCTWCEFRDACWGGVDSKGRPRVGLPEIF